MSFLRISILVVLSACSKIAPSPSATRNEGSARLQSPLEVTFEQLELSPSKVRLLAHVKRLAPIKAAMTVKFEVPQMARMTMGRTSFEVKVNSQPDELLEPIELTYSQLPVQDLVARVTATGGGGGFNYAVPYRFGRTAATAASPKAEGPPVIFHGRPMGQSISLDPKPEAK